MAARDYPPDNADPAPGGEPAPAAHAHRREYGVPHPNDVSVVQRIVTAARFILTALTVLYCTAFLAILIGIEYYAEEYYFLSTAMYLPPWGWLVPLAPLAFLSLFVYARLLIAHAICVPILIFGFMDLRWHSWATPLNPTVKVVSNNIGQSHKTSFKDFADLQKADLIALQDAPVARGPEHAQMFPGRYIAVKDQFTLISKFPIRAADALPWEDTADERHAAGQRQRVAAWFEAHGQPLLIFMVHMPTPRDQLNAMKGLGAFSALLGREGGHGSKVREDNAKFFANQRRLAQLVVNATRAARAPFIVCGDFNVPTHGQTYRLYRENWLEAFNERGQGVGGTFPGDAPLPPWLRLDNIYCSRTGLRPIHAEAEEGRKSQHLAMAATFELTNVRR
jgi:endonuclease/exonuclease/phosphatase family metal-dependent hydrolase